jgi:hypothetical protein
MNRGAFAGIELGCPYARRARSTDGYIAGNATVVDLTNIANGYLRRAILFEQQLQLQPQQL